MYRDIIKEQSDFLDETVKYYTENPARRCVIGRLRDKTCAYNPADVGKEGISEGCAIGRLMTQAQKEAADNDDVVNVLDEKVIPERLKGFDKRFLRAVQSWHDDNLEIYWLSDNGGLTDAGREKIEEIRKAYLTNS